MKPIYQRAGVIYALLGPLVGDSDQAMKALVDSCKPDSGVLSISSQLHSSSRYFSTPPGPNNSFILLELST
jgi:hypothetical protein